MSTVASMKSRRGTRQTSFLAPGTPVLYRGARWEVWRADPDGVRLLREDGSARPQFVLADIGEVRHG